MEDDSMCNFLSVLSLFFCKSGDETNRIAAHFGQDTPVKEIFNLSLFWLKLQSVTFTSLSPSLFENLELQFLAELSSVHVVVIRDGFNLMF